MELLGDLFPELGRDGFLLSKYPADVCVGRNHLRDLNDLDELVSLSFSELLRRVASTDDFVIYDQTTTPPLQSRHKFEIARSLLASGHCATIETAEDAFPILVEWKEALRIELGLIGPVAPVSIVLSPKSSRIPMHHDGVELLIVHLKGEKRWWFSPNEVQPNANYAYFPSEQGPGPRGGTRPRYREANNGPNLEQDGHSIVLKPGNCLFLPVGWWHQTEAVTDCLNLVFRLQTKPAYWVVAEAVADALSQIPRWRKPIPGLAGDEGLRLLALKALSDVTPHLASDLNLTTLASPQALLRPHTGAHLRPTQSTVEVRVSSDCVVLRNTTQTGSNGEVRFPVSVQPVLEWVLARKRSFTESDFHWASGIPIYDSSNILHQLVNLGILTASGPLYFK